MSTRSNIGIIFDDLTVAAIYCHWSGSPEDNGAILLEHYTTKEKVRQLMDLGDISTLGKEIGEKHDFEKSVDGWCNAYGRDRGEIATGAKWFPNVATACSELTQDYVYLFKPDGTWSYRNWDGPFSRLTTEVTKG